MFERNKHKQASTPAPAGAPVTAQPVTAAPAPPAPPITPTTSARNAAMIGPGIRIKGEVSGEEDLVVQGAVEGTIRLAGNQLIVGESGKVNADIQAKTVKIDGEVSGDIVASENVVISKLGNVQGNIVAPRVSLEDGAVFKGSIDMNPAETPGKARPVVAAGQEPAKIPTPENRGPQLDLKHG